MATQDDTLRSDGWRDPRRLSLASLLALAIGAVAVAAMAGLAIAGVGLLREQAEAQALARVELAGVAARDQLRRQSEDALTAARLLAGRPTLERLLRGGDTRQLELFLRRFCTTAGLDACGVVDDGAVVAAFGRVPWAELAEPAAEQGERFLYAPPAAPAGVLGAMAPIAALPGLRAVVLRQFDQRLAAELNVQSGTTTRLQRVSSWLEDVAPDLKELHLAALSAGRTTAAYLEGRGAYVSSTPVVAVTGEAVALIEASLPGGATGSALERVAGRLLVVALVLAALTLLAAWLLARSIGSPLRALATAATRLGQGDFSASFPARGTREVAALGRTMESMRRDLVTLTAALRRREAEAQALLQGVVEGVFAVDEARRIRYLNPQAARMLGVDAQAAIGRFCGDLLRPCGTGATRPCEAACPILAARAEGRAVATELLEPGSGPRRTVVITSAAPADGLQVQVMRDETELEAVRRARDSILANISHEFRTPLAAQQASIELLRDGLEARLPPEELQTLVASLQRGTLRLTQLIDNLLESVRIEAGQLAIRRAPVALADVVDDACQLLEGLFAQRRQRVEVTLPPDLPVVEGDGQRLTQVLINLLANAAKFGPEGSCVRVGAAASAGSVSLWVEDEGEGGAMLADDTIFERFYRSADAEPEPRGMGLGLWIVRSIVERHGGTVRAGRSAEGRTRFTVTLPAQGAAP